MVKNATRIGPHSRRLAIGKIDGRRREAKLMQGFAAELTRHIGGKPSVVQKRLIERAAVLHLRIALMDQQTEPGGGMTERNAREYLCWHNAYVRTIAGLGMNAAKASTPALRDYLDARASP